MHLPQGPSQPPPACAGGMLSTAFPLCFLCTCSSNPEIFAAWCKTVSHPLSASLSHPPRFSSSLSEMPHHLQPLVPYFISSVHTVFMYLSREYRTTSVICSTGDRQGGAVLVTWQGLTVPFSDSDGCWDMPLLPPLTCDLNFFHNLVGGVVDVDGHVDGFSVVVDLQWEEAQ